MKKRSSKIPIVISFIIVLSSFLYPYPTNTAPNPITTLFDFCAHNKSDIAKLCASGFLWYTLREKYCAINLYTQNPLININIEKTDPHNRFTGVTITKNGTIKVSSNILFLYYTIKLLYKIAKHS